MVGVWLEEVCWFAILGWVCWFCRLWCLCLFDLLVFGFVVVWVGVDAEAYLIAFDTCLVCSVLVLTDWLTFRLCLGLVWVFCV